MCRENLAKVEKGGEETELNVSEPAKESLGVYIPVLKTYIVSAKRPPQI